MSLEFPLFENQQQSFPDKGLDGNVRIGLGTPCLFGNLPLRQADLILLAVAVQDYPDGDLGTGQVFEGLANKIVEQLEPLLDPVGFSGFDLAMFLVVRTVPIFLFTEAIVKSLHVSPCS
jgi:hypothetical protein